MESNSPVLLNLRLWLGDSFRGEGNVFLGSQHKHTQQPQTQTLHTWAVIISRSALGTLSKRRFPAIFFATVGLGGGVLVPSLLLFRFVLCPRHQQVLAVSSLHGTHGNRRCTGSIGSGNRINLICCQDIILFYFPHEQCIMAPLWGDQVHLSFGPGLVRYERFARELTFTCTWKGVYNVHRLVYCLVGSYVAISGNAVSCCAC